MAPSIVGAPRRRFPPTAARHTSAIECSCYAFVAVFVVVVLAASSHYKHYRREHPELWAPPAGAAPPRVLPHGVAYTLEQARLAQHMPPPSHPNAMVGWRDDGLGYQQNLVKLRHSIYDISPPPPLPPAPPLPAHVEPRGELVLAVVLMRGGDRTAMFNFADFEKGYAWPGGLGRLSARGMQQAFHVGAELHRRYQQRFHLWNATYKPDHMVMWAADYERTIDSMNAALLGLFPPAGGRQSSVHSDCLCRARPAVRERGSLGTRGEGIRCIAECVGYRLPRWWLAGSHQQVHVRTVEPKQDWRLNALKACRVSAAASRQHTHDKRWQRAEAAAQQQVFQLARLLDPDGTSASAWPKTQLCDVSVQRVTDTRLAAERGDTQLKRACVPLGLHALQMVWSNLKAASVHKQPPLQGADREQLLRDWASIREYALRRIYGEHTGGGLLHEVLETLVRGTLRGRGGRDAPAKLKHTPKLTFYSAQEGTVLSFLAALNATAAPLPEFGDYVTVELWQHTHKMYDVRVDYQGRPLTGVAGCPLGRCRHSDFLDTTWVRSTDSVRLNQGRPLTGVAGCPLGRCRHSDFLDALRPRAPSPAKAGCYNWEQHPVGVYWTDRVQPPPAPKRTHLHGVVPRVDGGDWQVPARPPPGAAAAAPPSPPAPAARRSIPGSSRG